MADITVTAGSVVKSTGAVVETAYLAGTTITAGQLVYLSTSNTWLLTDNDASATAAVIDGVALNGAASGQPIVVQTSGDINLGATLTQGVVYGNSSTAGGIAPVSDHGAGDYVGILGVAISTSILRMSRVNSGITHA